MTEWQKRADGSLVSADGAYLIDFHDDSWVLFHRRASKLCCPLVSDLDSPHDAKAWAKVHKEGGKGPRLQASRWSYPQNSKPLR